MSQAGRTAADNFDIATDEIVEDVRETPGQMARALLDGLEALGISRRPLEEAQEREMQKGRRIKNNLARLTSVELAQGLSSQDDAIRFAAQQLQQDLINALTIDGYSLGENLMTSFANGVHVGKTAALNNVRLAADAIRGIFPSSEPKDPSSPFRGWTHLGGDMLRMLADDWMAALGVGRTAGMALASALTPNLTPGALGAGGAGGAMAGGGPTFVLMVDGERRVVGERDDVLDGWQQLRAIQ